MSRRNVSMKVPSVKDFCCTPYPKRQPVESLDYETWNNQEFQDYVAKRSRKDVKIRALLRWVLLILIALLVAVTYRFIDFTIDKLSVSIKTMLVENLTANQYGVAWLANTGIMMACVTLAAVMVIAWPPGGGSGIPEVLAWLNGQKTPNAMDFWTLVVKIFGVILAVGCGLYVGPEGPTIHIGALIGVRVVRDASWLTAKFFPKREPAESFRNDEDERMFVAIGAAAGIAAAFRAPIGGVLFAIEEAVSFHSSKLIYRCYLTTAFCYYFLQFIVQGALLDSGDFTAFEIDYSCDLDYQALDVFYFVIIGIIGGLLGVLFTAVSMRIRAFRSKYITAWPYRRFLECMVIVLITSTLVVFAPLHYPCTNLHTLAYQARNYNLSSWGDLDTDGSNICVAESVIDYFSVHPNLTQCVPSDATPKSDGSDCLDTYLELEGLVQENCEPGFYNELASLMHISGHRAVRNLFKQGEYYVFSMATIGIFFVCYFFLAVISNGMSVPAGLVIPMLTIGACMGRGFALFANEYLNTSPLVDPGSWAVIGGAAFWCGCGRITVTIAVIVFEVTGDVQFLPAIALAIVGARFTGNFFSDGVYEQAMELSGVTFLVDVASKAHDRVTVSAKMRKPICVPPKQSVESAKALLQSCSHNAFPVTTPESDPGIPGRLVGMMKRSQIETLLENHDYVENLLDYSPYMHRTPYTVHEDHLLSQAYMLFRTLGLRHLCIVNLQFRCVGILTRKDIAYHHGHDDPAGKDEHDSHGDTLHEPLLAHGDDVSQYSTETSHTIHTSFDISHGDVE